MSSIAKEVLGPILLGEEFNPYQADPEPDPEPDPNQDLEEGEEEIEFYVILLLVMLFFFTTAALNEKFKPRCGH